MAIKRGPGGIPEDVPTVPRRNADSSPNGGGPSPIGGDDPTLPPDKLGIAGGDDPTLPPDRSGGSSSPSGLFPEDPPTAPAHRRKSSGSATGPQVADEPPTIIGRGRKRRATAQVEQADSVAEPSEAMSDPVAGWLVIVDGPGKGNYVKVGYGQNSIGRGANERISLNFGDGQISSNNHAVISYDPRSGQFYIQQGSGKNLAYLDDAPVLAPTPLESESNILLGETTLRFVAFCHADFSWEKLEEEA